MDLKAIGSVRIQVRPFLVRSNLAGTVACIVNYCILVGHYEAFGVTSLCSNNLLVAVVRAVTLIFIIIRVCIRAISGRARSSAL